VVEAGAGERDRPTGAEAASVRSKHSPHARAGPFEATDRGKPRPNVAQADRPCGQPLQELQGDLDTAGQGGGQADNLRARSGAGAGGYDQLRLPEGRGVGGGSVAIGENEPALSFRGLSAVLRAFYGARIEAVCRTLSARERDAAVRSLLDDRAAALSVLAHMRAASVAALKERKQIVRRGRREAAQRWEGRQESNLISVPHMS
jgi:hypothetical protein